MYGAGAGLMNVPSISGWLKVAGTGRRGGAGDEKLKELITGCVIVLKVVPYATGGDAVDMEAVPAGYIV